MNDIDPSLVHPGVAGAIMVGALMIATILIIRGLLKHMKRVPKDEHVDEQDS